MDQQLIQIKTLRKKLGLTQHELASQSNVSQSLIAKIESGIMDPSFSKAQRILEVLTNISKKQEKTAKDLMYHKLFSVNPNTKIHAVIAEMRKHNISQVPVLKGSMCVGIVSESLLLEAVGNPQITQVKDIMGDAPPIVGKDAPASLLANLLRTYPIVIVAEKGAILGVITKADMLKVL